VPMPTAAYCTSGRFSLAKFVWTFDVKEKRCRHTPPRTCETRCSVVHGQTSKGMTPIARCRDHHRCGSVRRRVQGEEHPETLLSTANLATILAHQAKFSEAEEMLQATLEAYRRVLGDAHPRTLGAAQSLENVRSSMYARRAADQDSPQGCSAAHRPRGHTGALTDGAGGGGSEGEGGGGGAACDARS
jgi:hypothetical protein